jgi:nitrite reductase/ring-hydroxylating ferredoxin subunit
VFAVRNSCPHQSGPLCAGSLLGRLESPGVGEVTRAAGPVLACPWHGWEFDLETGWAVWDRRYRVTTFPTTVENGRVLVEIGQPRG